MSDMDDETRPDGMGPESDRPPERPAARPVPWRRSEAWDVSGETAEESGEQARPLASLVSFHYLRAAVRRRWRFCAALPAVGLALGAAFLVAVPAPRTATTTLRLFHPEEADPDGAIATDISLMTTRTVAERTIKALGLTMSPMDLMNSVKAETTGSSEILNVNLQAPSDAEAVRILDQFTKEYLTFRAKQISAQSDIVTEAYKDRIGTLRSQSRMLTKRIESLIASGDTSGQLNDAAAEKQQVEDNISSLQTTIDDTNLRQEAVVKASQVIDPAAPVESGHLRRPVLVLASGLIAGLAIGFGVVVLRAILSDRLWLRIEVASALNAPVLLSVRKIAPLSRLVRIVRFLPWVKARDTRRAVDRQRMANAIERAVPEPGRRQSLAVVCLGNSGEMRFGLAAAAVELQHHGRTTTIVDLTEAGGVASAVARVAGTTAEWTPQVFRPSVIPSLAKGPTQVDSADWEDVALAKGRTGVTLILADLDPGVGVDHLTAWTDRVIVAVTGGRSSAELVRTTADLIRTVGLQLRGSVLLRAARDDMSSGIATPAKDESAELTASQPDWTVGRPLQP